MSGPLRLLFYAASYDISAMTPGDFLKMLMAYQMWAHCICAPVFWQKGDGVTHNGSMTFLRTESDVLGITNAHVADAIVGCNEEVGNRCQVGGAYLDPARLIAKHPTMDLATYRLSDIILNQTAVLIDGAIGDTHHQAATVDAWPPAIPDPDQPVMYGGYPGAFRREKVDGNVEFGFFWFANKVQSISDTKVGMVIDMDHSISIGRRRLSQGANLGGWSGGPVFRVIKENDLERLQLSSIIFEYSEGTGIVLTHPLTDLNPDGTFNA